MKSMENYKSPGSEELTKEFYVTFWNDIKATFVSSLKQAKETKELYIKGGNNHLNRIKGRR